MRCATALSNVCSPVCRKQRLGGGKEFAGSCGCNGQSAAENLHPICRMSLGSGLNHTFSDIVLVVVVSHFNATSGPSPLQYFQIVLQAAGSTSTTVLRELAVGNGQAVSASLGSALPPGVTIKLLHAHPTGQQLACLGQTPPRSTAGPPPAPRALASSCLVVA
jgi:hypothetical protein